MRANLVTTTGSRSVEQGPITFAGIHMGLILVVVHELLEVLRKVEKKGAVQLTP